MFGHRSSPVSNTLLAVLLASSAAAFTVQAYAGNESVAQIRHANKSLVAPSLPSQTTVIATTPAASPGGVDGDDWCHYGRHSPCRWRPRFNLALEGGVAFTGVAGNSVFRSGEQGAGVHPGASWGARGGLEWLSWLGFEARYLGAYHHNSNTGMADTSRVLTSAGIVVVRVTLPIRFLRPYAFAGVGVYVSSVAMSGPVTPADPTRVRAGVPLGIGLEVPIGWRFAIGVEATYHRLFGGETTSGAAEVSPRDLVTTNALLRFRL